MINFDRFILNFFATFDLFVSRKYVFGDKAFTRVRKMSQKDYTKYILTQFGCNGYTESIRFFTKGLNRKIWNNNFSSNWETKNVFKARIV